MPGFIPFLPATRRLPRNAAITGAVLAGHALVFAWLAWSPSPPQQPAGPEGPVVLGLVNARPATAPHAARPTPQPKPKPATPPLAPSPEPEPAQPEQPPSAPQLSPEDAAAVDAFDLAAATGAEGQACDLTAALHAEFAQNTLVHRALTELPSTQRSVANAVMLWDGRWPDDSLTGGKALLRALLTHAVSTARPECLQQAQTGPVLFLVPDQQTTVVLAVGSGRWTWGDLLPAPDYFTPVASVTPPAP